MFTPSWHRQLLAALALVALGGAQLFGLSRGYLCDCSGGYEITAFDHCHGPQAGHQGEHDHGQGHGHEDAEPHHEHHEEGDVPADHDTRHHTPATETVTALNASAKSALAVVSLAPVVMICEVLFLPKAFETPFVVPTALLRDDGGGRRWPRMLAHTIALRV